MSSSFIRPRSAAERSPAINATWRPHWCWEKRRR